jgi:succinyl-CoA synthetase beta subunit
VVVKAQIHAGGRGKGGGVKLAKNAEDCESIAKAMLGMTLRTHQTGPEGRIVRRLLIEEGMNLEGAREMYLAIILDRATGCPVVMASSQGGMDIEEVAAKDPTAILKEVVTRSACNPSRRASWPSPGLRRAGQRSSWRRCTGPSKAWTPPGEINPSSYQDGACWR